MQACPLTFAHPSEAQQLDGIGEKICKKLTDKLIKHCKSNGLPTPQKPRGKARRRLSAEDLEGGDDSPPAKKPRKAKPYVPTYRTGPYAIILALSSLPDDSLQSLTKAQVIELAQPLCDSSFVKPSHADKFYTAWNSINTLINKDLVQEKGRPLRKYVLTEEGWDVARRMRRAVEDNDKEGKKVANKVKSSKPTAIDRSLESMDGFHKIEHSFEGEGFSLPQPEKAIATGDVPRLEQVDSKSNGRPLGGAPFVKYSTFTKARGPKPLLPRNIVELLSSPEPGANQGTPWATSAVEQNTRQYDSKPSTKAPQSALQPTPSNFMQQPTTTTSAEPSTTLPTFNAIVLQPGTFTVRLVLDNREVRAKGDRDHISDELKKHSCDPIARSLALGDFFWVAKMHDDKLLSRCYGEAGDEVALDWIVERKRLDDLVGSITDGRFQEQRFRLRKSGVKKVIYLIEEFSLSTEKSAKFHDAIQTAIASTQVVNGYFVKRTQKLDETIRYLARMTRMLKSIYENKPLHLIPTSALESKTYLPLVTYLRSNPLHKDKTYCITYPSFASLSSKSDTITLRDIFLKMLMCTRSISGEKALAIQKVWPTPRTFVEAFENAGGKRERNELIEKELGGLVGRGRIKGVLAMKVANIWGEE